MNKNVKYTIAGMGIIIGAGAFLYTIVGVLGGLCEIISFCDTDQLGSYLVFGMVFMFLSIAIGQFIKNEVS